jgi:hypothetical protein
MGLGRFDDGEPHRDFRDRELVEESWRAIGVDGRIVTCAIYRLYGPGFEVRVGYSTTECHRIQRVANLFEGRDVARVWRDSVLGQGLVELTLRP